MLPFSVSLHSLLCNVKLTLHYMYACVVYSTIVGTLTFYLRISYSNTSDKEYNEITGDPILRHDKMLADIG